MLETVFSHLLARSSLTGGALCIIGLFGIWRLYLLNRPKMVALDQGGQKQMRAEMWRDIRALKASNRDTRRRLRHAEYVIARQDSKIAQQDFIIDLVITELERVSPDNSTAAQARHLRDVVRPIDIPNDFDEGLSEEERVLVAELDKVPMEAE